MSSGWTYSEQGSRDLRLDWLRGYATMAMVIDHIGDKSWLYIFTGGDTFFLSAAEAFVFISGMIVGVVYGRVLRQQGLGQASRKALMRAWTLYKLTVVSTLLFVVVSVGCELTWADWMEPSGTVDFLFNVLTLRWTFIFVDIPLMYTLLMALAPVGFFFLRGGRKRLITGLMLSWAVWFTFQFPAVQAAVQTGIKNNWTFKLPAWQLLFFNAMAIGYHRDYLAERLRMIRGNSRRIFRVAVSFLLVTFLLLVVIYVSDNAVLERILPAEFCKDLSKMLFVKPWLGAGRLVAAAVLFPTAFIAITIFWKPVYAWTRWLTMLGANSLYAYTMHLVLLVLFYASIPFLPFYWDFEILTNTVAEIGTIIAICWMIRTHFLFHTVAR